MEEWKGMKSVADVFSNSTFMLKAISSALDAQVEVKHKELMASAYIPQIVLMAFSCEMYLKSYISFQGGTVPRVHDLYELYRNLNKKIKSKLNKIITQKMRNYRQSYMIDNVEDDIRKIADVFEEWRYFYEKNNSIDIQFLESFFSSLKDPSIALPHAEK